MYFATHNPNTLATLSEAVSRADWKGQRFRINVDSDGNLTFKVGEGMWSAPYASDLDPYRDNSGS